MRARRAALNYVTGVLFTAVTMVVGLVALPYLLEWLGEERYGAWRAAADWYGYLSLLELGIGGALLPLLARAVGRTDRGALNTTMGAGIRAYARQSALMVLGGLMLVVAIRYLVPVSAANRPDLMRAALVATAALLLTPLLPFRHLAEARQEGYRVNLLLLFQSLIITSAALLLAYSGWGITGQMLALLLGGAFFFGVLALGELRNDAGIARAAGGSVKQSEAWGELWRLNRPTLIRQLCGRVSVMSDRIIVAALLGPAMVVPLFVTQRLAELAQGQMQGVGTATWAGLAELHARGEHDTFNARLLELTALVTAWSVALLGPIVAYNHHFVSLWVGGERYAGDLVTIVVGVNGLLLAVITLWDWAFGGTGQVARLVPVSVVATAINLGLSLALTPRYGVAGPLLGTMCATLLTAAWYVPVLLHRTFGIALGVLARHVATPLLWGVPYVVVLWQLAHRRPAIGWATLAIEMAAGALAYLAVWWMLMLTVEQRAVHIARLRSVLRGR
ncbi:MAG: lipopolysaccharide biosynthesis protein [Gemmatimonadota bacterium]|nr:MAG: lipopolysaccharide biosynthesis protein [Gemmatimonadota bacterium]